MRRRPLLAAAMFGTISGLAGCLRGDGAPSVPEGMTVETRHWASDVLVEGIWHLRREQDEPVESSHTAIVDERAARSEIECDDGTSEFVDETDFERSYLLVVQNVMQSARWLELRRIERTGPGLDVTVVTASPDEPYGDDAVVHSLAIRVTDDSGDVPGELAVTVDGEPTGT